MPETSGQRKWFQFGRWLCKVFCRFSSKLTVGGLENVPETGPVLLISNHQSFLDPMLCGIFIDRTTIFMARDTLFKNWLFGWMIRSVNTIPVRRGEADITAMRTILSRLKDGYCVCLFPEGTRSPDGKISAFKPGFGLLARRGNASIVPVVIDGAFEAWPRQRKLFIRGMPISITYGKCITPEQIGQMKEDALADLLTATLRRIQTESRTKKGKPPFEY